MRSRRCCARMGTTSGRWRRARTSEPRVGAARRGAGDGVLDAEASFERLMAEYRGPRVPAGTRDGVAHAQAPGGIGDGAGEQKAVTPSSVVERGSEQGEPRDAGCARGARCGRNFSAITGLPLPHRDPVSKLVEAGASPARNPSWRGGEALCDLMHRSPRESLMISVPNQDVATLGWCRVLGSFGSSSAVQYAPVFRWFAMCRRRNSRNGSHVRAPAHRHRKVVNEPIRKPYASGPVASRPL